MHPLSSKLLPYSGKLAVLVLCISDFCMSDSQQPAAVCYFRTSPCSVSFCQPDPINTNMFLPCSMYSNMNTYSTGYMLDWGIQCHYQLGLSLQLLQNWMEDE